MICKHFGKCGGCQNQHMNEQEERVQKTQHFLNILRNKQILAEVNEYKISPIFSRRRASFTAKRTKKTVQIGFMEMGSHNVVEITECKVLLPEILALIPFMQNATQVVASRSALIKFHITACSNGMDIMIENSKELDAFGLAGLASLCAGGNIRRLLLGETMIYQDIAPQLNMKGHWIDLPPHPFLQATEACENWLREWINDEISTSKNIADLFSGIGTFSYGLSAIVSAFEGERSLSQNMKNNINRLTLNHLTSVERDLFRDPLSVKELAQFDAVIIDPPRAGAEAQCQQLAKSSVKKIAFISCDVSTFARDARIMLDGGYEMKSLKLIDQFRYSNHLESFALFEKLPNIKP